MPRIPKDTFIVSGVWDRRTEPDGTYKYLTSWEGYEEKTWEPVENFVNDAVEYARAIDRMLDDPANYPKPEWLLDFDDQKARGIDVEKKTPGYKNWSSKKPKTPKRKSSKRLSTISKSPRSSAIKKSKNTPREKTDPSGVGRLRDRKKNQNATPNRPSRAAKNAAYDAMSQDEDEDEEEDEESDDNQEDDFEDINAPGPSNTPLSRPTKRKVVAKDQGHKRPSRAAKNAAYDAMRQKEDEEDESGDDDAPGPSNTPFSSRAARNPAHNSMQQEEDEDEDAHGPSNAPLPRPSTSKDVASHDQRDEDDDNDAASSLPGTSSSAAVKVQDGNPVNRPIGSSNEPLPGPSASAANDAAMEEDDPSEGGFNDNRDDDQLDDPLAVPPANDFLEAPGTDGEEDPADEDKEMPEEQGAAPSGAQSVPAPRPSTSAANGATPPTRPSEAADEAVKEEEQKQDDHEEQKETHSSGAAAVLAPPPDAIDEPMEKQARPDGGEDDEPIDSPVSLPGSSASDSGDEVPDLVEGKGNKAPGALDQANAVALAVPLTTSKTEVAAPWSGRRDKTSSIDELTIKWRKAAEERAALSASQAHSSSSKMTEVRNSSPPAAPSQPLSHPISSTVPRTMASRQPAEAEEKTPVSRDGSREAIPSVPFAQLASSATDTIVSLQEQRGDEDNKIPRSRYDSQPADPSISLAKPSSSAAEAAKNLQIHSGDAGKMIPPLAFKPTHTVTYVPTPYGRRNSSSITARSSRVDNKMTNFPSSSMQRFLNHPSSASDISQFLKTPQILPMLQNGNEFEPFPWSALFVAKKRPAPFDCFWKRNIEKFRNPFEGMEGKALKFPDDERVSYTIGQVIGTHGPFVKVKRLYMTPSSAQWFHSEDACLQPLTSVRRCYRSADGDRRVPETAFARQLRWGSRPVENRFKVGHMLETYLPDGANGIFRPAEVVGIETAYRVQRIKIRYIGHNPPLERTLRFDDMRLYPCGYAAAVGWKCEFPEVAEQPSVHQGPVASEPRTLHYRPLPQLQQRLNADCELEDNTREELSAVPGSSNGTTMSIDIRKRAAPANTNYHPAPKKPQITSSSPATSAQSYKLQPDYHYFMGLTTSRRCPRCLKYFDTPKKKENHYIQIHYDFYYKFCPSPISELEKWMSRRIGMQQPSHRMCRWCANQHKMFNSRIELLGHMKFAHPGLFLNLCFEYQEAQKQEKIEDQIVHRILVKELLMYQQKQARIATQARPGVARAAPGTAFNSRPAQRSIPSNLAQNLPSTSAANAPTSQQILLHQHLQQQLYKHPLNLLAPSAQRQMIPPQPQAPSLLDRSSVPPDPQHSAPSTSRAHPQSFVAPSQESVPVRTQLSIDSFPGAVRSEPSSIEELFTYTPEEVINYLHTINAPEAVLSTFELRKIDGKHLSTLTEEDMMDKLELQGFWAREIHENLEILRRK